MSTDGVVLPFTSWIPSSGSGRRSSLLHSLRLWTDVDRLDTPEEPERPGPAEPERSELMFGEAELARACAAVAREAIERERGAHAVAQARSEAEALGRLSDCLGAAEDGFRSRLDALARGLSEAFASAVEAAGILQEARVARMQALLESILVEALQAPELRITAGAAVADALQRRLPASAAAAGYSGRMAFSTDAQLGPSSLRVEWADGWAESDLDHVERVLIDHLTHAGSAADLAGAAAPAED